MADDELLREIFYDSDSEEEFVGFCEEEARAARDRRDIGDGSGVGESESSESSSDSDDDGNEVPTGYDHTWLIEYAQLCGPKHVHDGMSETELFQLLISDDVLEVFVTETNRYAEQLKEKVGDTATRHARISKWRDTTLSEMKAFVALLLLIGLTKRSSYELYWSKDSIIEMCPYPCTLR
eukprot:TRINITY_DN5224_c0_g2_i5.p1 TRINITY_DN5224_c0_g2~~TRINITY_DN5224_c0_g2_i5.p1  ORF type:complete len:180 (+),score=19.17 TRINITY_DN5224_c0_g2_i5:114-653(+)